MTDEASTDEADDPSSGEVSDELAIDEQWAEAREAAGLDPQATGMLQGEPAVLSPYLLLYAGFFLGPVGALGATLGVAPKALTVRRIAFMLGICGAAWCVIQGATVLLAPNWDEVSIQVLRSGLNFTASATLLLFWRRESPRSFVHDRQIIGTSLLVCFGLLVLFAWLPTEFLAFTGR